MNFKRPRAISANITIKVMGEKSKICKDGHYRRWVKVKCSHCKKEIWKIKRDIRKCKTIFCSSSCKNFYSQKRIQKICAHCGKSVKKILAHVKNSKSNLFFCNRECQKKALAKNPNLFKKIKTLKCCRCGADVEADYRVSKKICKKCKSLKKQRYVIDWGKVLKGEETAPYHNNLRNYLIQNNIKENKCEICNITEWQNKPLTMHVHHKDGNRSNNKLENLEMNCPNCHTQTSTWGHKK